MKTTLENPTGKRILFISNFYPQNVMGGAEIIAHRHARGLARRGHDIIVLAGTPLSERDEPNSLEVDEIDGILVYRVPIASFEAAHNFWRAATVGHLQALIHAH